MNLFLNFIYELILNFILNLILYLRILKIQKTNLNNNYLNYIIFVAI